MCDFPVETQSLLLKNAGMIWLLSSIIFSLFAQSTENLPQLANSVAKKPIGYGYPLGGELGYLVGIQAEQLDSGIILPKFSFAKGIYNWIDLGLDFSPYLPQVGATHYSLWAKWSFYISKVQPWSASILFHRDSTNLGDSTIISTEGVSLLAHYYLSTWSFYVGGGYLAGRSKLPDQDIAQFLRSHMGLSLLVHENYNISVDISNAAQRNHLSLQLALRY